MFDRKQSQDCRFTPLLRFPDSEMLINNLTNQMRLTDGVINDASVVRDANELREIPQRSFIAADNLFCRHVMPTRLNS